MRVLRLHDKITCSLACRLQVAALSQRVASDLQEFTDLGREDMWNVQRYVGRVRRNLSLR